MPTAEIPFPAPRRQNGRGQRLHVPLRRFLRPVVQSDMVHLRRSNQANAPRQIDRPKRESYRGMSLDLLLTYRQSSEASQRSDRTCRQHLR